MSLHEGKGALVLGGSRGIGRAVVERLARDGAKDDLEALFRHCEDTLPDLDILVMNAAETARIPLADTPLEDFDRMFSANTRSSFLALRWAARRMRDGGRIVNISPLNTQLPTAGLALYMGSKAAAEQMTKAASRELGGRGITANTVSPGATDTEMLRGANPPEVLAAMPGMIALGRLGTAEDVAKVVAFLVGPDGAWMTGQNLLATGGMVI